MNFYRYIWKEKNSSN